MPPSVGVNQEEWRMVRPSQTSGGPQINAEVTQLLGSGFPPENVNQSCIARMLLDFYTHARTQNLDMPQV